MNKYNENKVIRDLSKNNNVRINHVDKTIQVVRNSNTVGNKSWGKIDYLTKLHGYILLFVDNITSKIKSKKVYEENDFISKKDVKKENKFNMAAMTKSAMRKAKNK